MLLNIVPLRKSLARNVQTNCSTNQMHSGIWQVKVKSNKVNFAAFWAPSLESRPLALTQKIHLCNNFLSILYLFDFIFQGSFDWKAAQMWWMILFPLQWLLRKLEKVYFSVILATLAKKKNASSKTWTLHIGLHRLDWAELIG